MAIKKVGHIANTFGIKGQLKVSISTSNPEERFAVGNKIIIKNQLDENQEYTISSYMPRNSRIVAISLEGFDNINQVQWMINKDVYADVLPPKGEYFFDELVSMKVISLDGNELGKVENVLTMAAGEYLQIDGKLVPFKIGLFIEKVSREDKIITLTKLGEEALA